MRFGYQLPSSGLSEHFISWHAPCQGLSAPLLPQAVPWGVPSPGAGPWHPPNHSMCTPSRDGGHDPAQVTGDGDTPPWDWDTCGVSRHGWALGRMQGSGRRRLPTTKGAWITTVCAVHPAPGSPRHQSRTSVTHAESGQEFPPSPTGGNALGPHPAPVPDLPGEGLPARGWDGSSRLSGSGRRLSPLQPFISHRSGARPPALPGRGGSHRLSPGTQGAPKAQTPGS